MIPNNTMHCKMGLGKAILAGAMLLAGAVCSTAVKAEPVTDALDSWQMTAGHSPGLVLDNTNPNYFYNDNSRVKNGDSGVGSFYYHSTGMSSFAAFVYFWNNLGRIEVYTSPDNVTWTPLTFNHTDITPTTQNSTDGWASARIYADVPPGTNYVAFTLRGDPAHVWTPQVGQVSLDVVKNAPAIPGPGGLSVVAAGSQAALAWYPTKGANSYTVKRRTAESKEFHTVASGVTSTTYNDDGLTNGSKYYYAVFADTEGGKSGESDEVLAVPAANSVVMADPLTDWSLTSAHTAKLEFTRLAGDVACVRRTANTRESFEYNVPGASGFTANIYSTGTDLTNSVSVESSPDGTTWSIVPTSLKLAAKADAGLFAAVCSPSGKLPSDTNYIRFVIGDDGLAAADPSIGQVRITYGATTVRTAAAHPTAKKKDPQ
jgi:hypothetical protein